MHIPILNPDKAIEIIKDRDNLKDIPYISELHFESQDDEDVYNL